MNTELQDELIRVINVHFCKSASTDDLAIRTKQPRTTVLASLRALKRKGLVYDYKTLQYPGDTTLSDTYWTLKPETL